MAIQRVASRSIASLSDCNSNPARTGFGSLCAYVAARAQSSICTCALWVCRSLNRARMSHPNGTSTKLLETKDVSVQVVRIGPRGMLYTVTRPNGKAENWLLKFCLQGTPRPLTSFSWGSSWGRAALAPGDLSRDPGALFCAKQSLSLIHISEPTRQAEISYAVFCLKKK